MFKTTCIRGTNLKIYSLSEKRRVYRGINSNQNDSVAYKIDGCVFKQETSCDFMLINSTKKNVYFIECKGSKVCHACAQIETTIENLKHEFSNYVFYGRIISTNNNSHNLNSSEYKSLKRVLKAINKSDNVNHLIIKSILLEESIS